MIDARIRLVFAEAVGRHVQRRYGFSSCWYLVPRDAKLVGDLSHALLREFELRKRCSMGLELRLEELPMLATQSIRIVRDNDTITVQCPTEESENSRMVASSESEVEAPRKTKRTLGIKKDLQQPLKKIRPTKVVSKAVKRRLNASVDSRRMATLKSIRVESSSSSYDSSSSSKSSSEMSSSSEPKNEPTVRHALKCAVSRHLKQQSNKAGSAKVPSGWESKAIAPAPTKKKPRRRRRRLRQRNRGQQSKEMQANNTPTSVQLYANAAASPNLDSGVSVMKRGNKASSLAIPNGNITADARGYPRAKAHVLFDEYTGDPVPSERDAAVTKTRTIKGVARKLPAPELAKYGPASSTDLRYESPSRNHQSARDSYNGSKQKGKEEQWKRSYEIVATVFDEKLHDCNRDNLTALNLSKALTSFPAISVTSSRFALKDVIAFKTLTLCLETCQPVLSEWKCGQVQAMDATCTTIEMSSWDLEFQTDSVTFHESPGGEMHSLHVSDITELRYLSGPSCTAPDTAG